MWFKLLYLFYLILAFLFPAVSLIGPLSIRHVVMLLMLVISVFKGARWDVYLTLYTIFIFFFSISSIITGYSNVLLNKLLGTYLQAYVFYFSTCVLIKKYNGVQWLYVFFFVFGLLDAFVTIGQFYHLPFAEKIVLFVGYQYDEQFVSLMNRYDKMEGVALPGLVGSVRNGYFLSAVAVLALYNKNNSISIINWGAWLVIMAASLLSQERMGFIAAVLLSLFVIVFTMSMKSKRGGWAIAIISVMILIFVFPIAFDALQGSNLRYSQGFDMGGSRSTLALIGWNFFLNHPLGAFYEFESMGYPYPHNVIVNIFLVGGFFGGMVLLIMFIKQLFVLIKYLYWSLKSRKISFAAFFALAFLAYTMNSFTHNYSIAFGTFEFFLFFSAFLTLRSEENFYIKNGLEKENPMKSIATR